MWFLAAHHPQCSRGPGCLVHRLGNSRWQRVHLTLCPLTAVGVYPSYVAQDIDGGANLPVGTIVTVSEDYYGTGGTVEGGCFPYGPPGGPVTAIGSFEVGIVPKSEGVIKFVIPLAESGGGSWTKLSGSATITTPAAYLAVWVVSTQVAAVAGLKGHKCTLGLIEGQGYATDLSVQVN
jgi:hypothetical protein